MDGWDDHRRFVPRWSRKSFKNEKTLSFFNDNKSKIESFIRAQKFDKVVFLGCGSCYQLSKSAAFVLTELTGIQTAAIPGGDLMINFAKYTKFLENSMVVAISRSGTTSEVLYAINKMRQNYSTPVLLITMTENSELAKVSDFTIDLPWAYDESVCQTRNVTNLYAAQMLLNAIWGKNDKLFDGIAKAILAQRSFIELYEKDISNMASEKHTNFVVLADAELDGLAEEGALAFKEICQLQSNYYHVLDVRHGPIVLITEKTLVIAVLNPLDEQYQKDLIRDIKARGATVITISNKKENIWGSDYNVIIDSSDEFIAWGIPFIFVPQILSLALAIKHGTNPDFPEGLDPYISL